MHPKSAREVLANSNNKNDYVIIDRTDTTWEYTDKNNILLVKTFAPLSSHCAPDPMITSFPIVITDAPHLEVMSTHSFPQDRVNLLSNPHIM
jgi:hypothetical protein